MEFRIDRHHSLQVDLVQVQSPVEHVVPLAPHVLQNHNFFLRVDDALVELGNVVEYQPGVQLQQDPVQRWQERVKEHLVQIHVSQRQHFFQYRFAALDGKAVQLVFGFFVREVHVSYVGQVAGASVRSSCYGDLHICDVLSFQKCTQPVSDVAYLDVVGWIVHLEGFAYGCRLLSISSSSISCDNPAEKDSFC